MNNKANTLRRQADALEEAARKIRALADQTFSDDEFIGYKHSAEVCSEDARQLRQQADEMEQGA